MIAATRQAPEPPAVPAVVGPFKVAVVLLCGTVLGLAGTAAMLERRIDPAAIRIGPWTTMAKSGSGEMDPYAQAIDAQTGAIALAPAEGLSFTAIADSTGAPLSTDCAYGIDGPVPAAKFWTLTATTPDGRLMDNPAGRAGFSSSDILRRDDGTFSIVVAPRARPGNWLPVSGGRRFILTLRLYDTLLSSISGDLGKTLLPSISPLGCPP